MSPAGDFHPLISNYTKSLLILYDILLSFFPTEITEFKKISLCSPWAFKTLCPLWSFFLCVLCGEKNPPQRTQRFFCGLWENIFNNYLVLN